jgi:hypothetical protein
VIYKLRFLHWLQTEQAGTAGTSWNQWTYPHSRI